MKIVYLINSLENPGGMERVLANKANYFSQKFGYKVYIVTTDQDSQTSFYKLNDEIKMINLSINYFEDKKKNFIKRILPFIAKQKTHKQEIKRILSEIKPDFVVSMGCEDTCFLTKIKDGSFKIREFHFGKNYRKEYAKSFNRGFVYTLKAYFDTIREEYISKKYDKVILLTQEDKQFWKNNKNIEVIYNSISEINETMSNCVDKKVISVGKLDGQKGYDRLIDIWKKVKEKDSEWILEIYGEGIDRKELQNKIDKNELKNSFILKGSTKRIIEKYQESSIYVMTSRYEGMPMVLIEAMSLGLPVISFDCLSGPRDIIKHGEDGYLIKNGDNEEFTKRLLELMNDFEKRKNIGINAKKNTWRFSEDTIMQQWKNLFENLKK
ncbi:MAG: glycosyltransferase family 4 protein [Fusobacteriaceae bacterium]